MCLWAKVYVPRGFTKKYMILNSLKTWTWSDNRGLCEPSRIVRTSNHDILWGVFFCDTFHYSAPTGSALSIFIKRAGKITYITRFLQGKVDQGAPVYKSATETQGVMGGVTATTVLCFPPKSTYGEFFMTKCTLTNGVSLYFTIVVNDCEGFR